MRTGKLSLGITAFFSVMIALMTFRFASLGLTDAFPSMDVHIDASRMTFLVHILASSVALALGAFQFMPAFRARRPLWHRWAGRIYGAACVAGGVAGLLMAPRAPGGIVAASGFAVLAVIWILITANAVRLAMQRDFVAHRQWMIRSFALTFGAVTLRVYLPFFFLAGMEYPEASQWVAWLAWVPNLLFAELLIARGARAAAH